MANYGIRVSKAGKDVKSAVDADMLLTTAKSIPKAEIWTQITVTSGSATYNHNLGYVPMVVAFLDDISTTRRRANVWPVSGGGNVIFVRATTTQILVNTNGSSTFYVYLYLFHPEI